MEGLPTGHEGNRSTIPHPPPEEFQNPKGGLWVRNAVIIPHLVLFKGIPGPAGASFGGKVGPPGGPHTERKSKTLCGTLRDYPRQWV